MSRIKEHSMIQIRNRQGILGDPTPILFRSGEANAQRTPSAVNFSWLTVTFFAEVTRCVTDCLVAFRPPRQGVDAVHYRV